MQKPDEIIQKIVFATLFATPAMILNRIQRKKRGKTTGFRLIYVCDNTKETIAKEWE